MDNKDKSKAADDAAIVCPECFRRLTAATMPVLGSVVPMRFYRGICQSCMSQVDVVQFAEIAEDAGEAWKLYRWRRRMAAADAQWGAWKTIQDLPELPSNSPGALQSKGDIALPDAKAIIARAHYVLLTAAAALHDLAKLLDTEGDE